MRPQQDPARRCLPVAAWPDTDRRAWEAALASGDPLSPDCSPAARWRPETVHKYRRGYGRWLTHLASVGADLSGPLAGRVTREQVCAWLDVLDSQDVSAWTRRNRVHELFAVMRALAPEHDWGWLGAAADRLDRRAQETADRSLPPLLVADVLARCTAELGAIPRPVTSRRTAVRARDWTLLAFLAVLPLRLRNLAGLSIARHLRRREEGWWIDIDGPETKTGRPLAACLPADASDLLDAYIAEIRPVLDRGAGGDALWLAMPGGPIAPHSIYIAVTQMTRETFGFAVNPHRFRHIFASTVSLAGPDSIEGARAALGHASRLTTQHHYVRATTVAAGRQHASLVQRLRKAGRSRARRRPLSSPAKRQE